MGCHRDYAANEPQQIVHILMKLTMLENLAFIFHFYLSQLMFLVKQLKKSIKNTTSQLKYASHYTMSCDQDFKK
jgi:hypothetical protein